MIHPAWQEACREAAVVLWDEAGPLSPCCSPRCSARSAESMRSRRSVRSTASTQTCTSLASSGSHLSQILPAMGLDPLPDAGPKGHYSGATCYDGNGTKSWPDPWPSVEAGAEEKEGSEEWCTYVDVRDNSGSVSASGGPAGGTLGKIHSGKMAGASRGKVTFSEPTTPARHDPVIMCCVCC
mmetsp:Transcript_165593/g.531485  ORF Transcript_165593/g.531485 Transcript_165593/m.531485 type:complete len:182 (-) Transcript_165593:179-724(-)